MKDEIQDSNNGDGRDGSRVKHVPRIDDGWQKVIDREELMVWQKPVPGSYVYEYKGIILISIQSNYILTLGSWSMASRF